MAQAKTGCREVMGSKVLQLLSSVAEQMPYKASDSQQVQGPESIVGETEFVCDPSGLSNRQKRTRTFWNKSTASKLGTLSQATQWFQSLPGWLGEASAMFQPSSTLNANEPDNKHVITAVSRCRPLLYSFTATCDVSDQDF